MTQNLTIKTLPLFVTYLIWIGEFVTSTGESNWGLFILSDSENAGYAICIDGT